MTDSNFSRKDVYEGLEFLEFAPLTPRRIEKDMTEANNTNYECCKKCGGKCCKTCGCCISPDDFNHEISFEFLKQEIKKGYISIEYIDHEDIHSDMGIYILRVRNLDSPIVDLHIGKHQCILLRENGCKLTYAERPSGGKLLIPSKTEKCYSKYGLVECCYEWSSYQEILNALSDYFLEKDFPCIIG